MMEERVLLGVDVGADFLKLGSCQKNQIEISSEKEIYQEKLSPDIIEKKINSVIESYGTVAKEKIRIVFSAEEEQIPLVKDVEKRLMGEGYVKSNLRLISRENAFIHYVISQEKELRKRTVYLFDFDGESLKAYKMEHSKKKTPLNYKAEKQVLGSFTLSAAQGERGRILDEKFASVLKQLFSKEVVSAVFLTGIGFEGDWLKKSLKILCDGRRAFVGQNLFSSGCCYYAAAMEEHRKKEFMIQAPETVLYEAGVLDGANKDAFYKVTEAGNAWYDTRGSVDVILERTGKVDVVFVNTVTGEKQVESVDISSLGSRPRKVGRFCLKIRFFDNKSGVITLCDEGFGDFLPATHQLFLKEFTLL